MIRKKNTFIHCTEDTQTQKKFTHTLYNTKCVCIRGSETATVAGNPMSTV